MNTRYGAGMGVLEAAAPAAPLALLQVALVAGHDVGLSSLDLGALLVPAADAYRTGGAWAVAPVTGPVDFQERAFVLTDHGCRWAAPHEPPDGALRLSPFGTRALVELCPEPGRLPSGSSLGPLAVAAFALADAEWGTRFGSLEAARVAGPAATLHSAAMEPPAGVAG